MTHGQEKGRAGSRCVLVVGCHRSGTSLVSCLLHSAGLAPATGDVDQAGDAFNPRGLWESRSLVEFNDELLREQGVQWDSAPFLPPDWWRTEGNDARLARIRALAERAGEGGDWCWKDPRLAVTLGLYVQALRDRMVVIWVQRHPLAVARSLQRRNHFPLRFGLAMWGLSTAHVAHALLPDIPLMVVHYEHLIQQPAVAWNALSEWLRQRGVERVDQAFKPEDHVDPKLAHESSSEPPPVDDRRALRLCEAVYDPLREAASQTCAAEGLRLVQARTSDRWREELAAHAVDSLLRESDKLRPLAVGYEKLSGHPLVRLARRFKRLFQNR